MPFKKTVFPRNLEQTSCCLGGIPLFWLFLCSDHRSLNHIGIWLIWNLHKPIHSHMDSQLLRARALKGWLILPTLKPLESETPPVAFTQTFELALGRLKNSQFSNDCGWKCSSCICENAGAKMDWLSRIDAMTQFLFISLKYICQWKQINLYCQELMSGKRREAIPLLLSPLLVALVAASLLLVVQQA